MQTTEFNIKCNKKLEMKIQLFNTFPVVHNVVSKILIIGLRKENAENKDVNGCGGPHGAIEYHRLY